MKSLAVYIIGLLVFSTLAVFSFDNRTAIGDAGKDFDVNLVPRLDTFTTVMESNTTDWDTTGISTPFVIYDAGLYKMWYRADSIPWEYPYILGREVIAYAESSDGVTWVNKQVVHDSGSVQPSYYITGSPWVIKEGGTYRMWHMDYYEWVAGDWSGYIAHMTSTDGIGWPAFMNANDQKVLSAQGQNTPQGDGFLILHACVIHEPAGYVMWYSVYDHTFGVPQRYAKIWRATSTDGITWTNRQLSLPYVTGTWEENVGGASVIQEVDGTYTMFYNAWYANGTGEAIGIAKSNDGVTWTERKQLLRASDLGANITFLYGAPGLVHFKDIDGKRYLYFNYYDKGDGKWKFGRIQLLLQHDVAITNVSPSQTVIGQGYSLNINVTAANQGDYTETFAVTVYANIVGIETKETTLTSGNSATIPFAWNTEGWAKGNYTISAFAAPVPGETDTADNSRDDGWVFITVPGDINGDKIVNVLDAVLLCVNFGKPDLNPSCDINGDGYVDVTDALILIAHFGEHW